MPDTARRNLSDELLTQVVLESFENAGSPRIKEVLQSLVKHLHAFAVDVQLTEEEWAYGIDFLTRTGHITDDKRQEFILLSDVLGLSMQVIGINHAVPDGATENTVFGPFFVADSPQFTNGDDIANGASGIPCYFHGDVRSGSGDPIEGANLEIWMADDEGNYDVQYADLDHAQGRGHISSAGEGKYWFWSVLPEAYPIPHDGPVGDLLKGAGRHPVASRAHPLPDQRAGLQDVHDARLRRRRRVPGLRRRLRREELADPGLRAPRRRDGHARRPRHRRRRVVGDALRLRAGRGGRPSERAGDGRPHRRQRPCRRCQRAVPEHAGRRQRRHHEVPLDREHAARAHHQPARRGGPARRRPRGGRARGQGRAATAMGQTVVLHEPGRRGARAPAHLGHAPRAQGRLHARQPVRALDMPQTYMEPILIGHAAERGSRVRFDTEYLSHVQDDEGVTTTVRDRRTGSEYTIRVEVPDRRRRRALADRAGHRAAVGGRHGLGGLDEHRASRPTSRTSSSTVRASCTGCCSRAPTSAASAWASCAWCVRGTSG